MTDPKLFVGNLGYGINESMLRDIFGEYGNIMELDLVIDKLTGNPRGFAFITFDKQHEAEIARKQLNGKSINGRPLRVDVATKKNGRKPRR